jgi:hypothetical protein
MAALMLAMALGRIAVSIAALKRVLNKPPPPSPPPTAPRIKSMFLEKSTSTRKKPRDFRTP